MNVSNLYVVITHWYDGGISYSTPYRGQAKAYRMAMRQRDIGMVSHVEIVTDREAGERKLRGEEGDFESRVRQFREDNLDGHY